MNQQSSKKSVLVVDDNELVRENVVTALTTLGYAVLQAENGPQAVQILASDADIDLLFTDMVMPREMSGEDLAKKAKELRPELKVLYTSGFTGEALAGTESSETSIELIKKPYRRAELQAKLIEILGE